MERVESRLERAESRLERRIILALFRRFLKESIIILRLSRWSDEFCDDGAIVTRDNGVIITHDDEVAMDVQGRFLNFLVSTLLDTACLWSTRSGMTCVVGGWDKYNNTVEVLK